MTNLPHLRLVGSHITAAYTYAGSTSQSVTFELPVRNRPVHAASLRQGLEQARLDAESLRNQQAATDADSVLREPEGFVLTFFSDPGYDLRLESLELRSHGIELLSVKVSDNVAVGKVFVPEGQLIAFLKRVDEYALSPDGSKNKKLVESIASVRLAIIQDFWQDTLSFPQYDETIWWEVWLRGKRSYAEETHARFRRLSAALEVRISERYVAFPERVVLHAFASARQLSSSLDLLAMVAELRKAKELATHYVDLTPTEQREFIEDLRRRTVLPAPDAPRVTVLDGGVNRGHPLLRDALAEEDMQSVDAAWGTHDHDPGQHGTGMAGIALYGCLTEAFDGTGPITLRHRLESVKILPPPPAYNEPPVYGSVTQEGVARAYVQEPNRNRVLCMAVSADDRDYGLPSTWSAAIDDMCAGVLDEIPKLMFVSAGNVRDELYEPEYAYHTWNCTNAGIEDPGQAWNTMTVGAVTDKVFIDHPDFEGWRPMAEPGDLTPTSRTSLAWPSGHYKGWPIKPDIVMEGGNYAEHDSERLSVDDLSLLTTILRPSGRLVETTRDTSPATAAASRMAAQIWAHYPSLWPETVRALMVHSASWTETMRKRFPGDAKSVVHHCLRCYGYGIPNLRRALNSAQNVATLIFEGELQPFRKEGSTYKTHEMHHHSLPWPTDVLEELGETPVTMRVTLSYFIEPSPNRVGWKKNHRYASHGLRFDVIRPLESELEFRRRISKTEWENPSERPPGVRETRNWAIGSEGRTHGSLHSDWWTGTAAELARCGRLAVYPVIGWWRERHHLGRYDRKARYSLVVSIETPRTEVDLYTPIANATAVDTEIMV